MQVRIDKDQLEDTRLLLKGLNLEGPKIISRALNKTVTQAQKRSSAKIREQVSLKASYVKSKLKIKRATWQKLSAVLTAEKRGVLMTQFSHTALKRGGVTVKIKAGGARKKMPTAFKTTVRAGSKRVDVIALPATGKYKTGNRRMSVLYAPSVSQVFNTVRDEIDQEMLDYLADETEKQIQIALKGF